MENLTTYQFLRVMKLPGKSSLFKCLCGPGKLWTISPLKRLPNVIGTLYWEVQVINTLQSQCGGIKRLRLRS